MNPMKPCQLLALGSFGTAVLQSLRDLVPHLDCSLLTREDVSDGTLSHRSVTSILVSAQPEPELCALLDDHAHLHRTAFVPLVIEAYRLRLGPVVLPGQSACWHCAQLRRRQHGVDLQDGSELRNHLAPHVLLAASRLARTLAELQAMHPIAGTTWQMDLSTTEVRHGLVIGVHSCPRCGLKRPLDTLSTRQMQRECAALWATPSDPA